MSVSYQTRENIAGSGDHIHRTYYASEAIGIGDAVIYDFTKTQEQKCEFVVKTPLAGKVFVGIAITSASANGIVQVQQAGYCNVAKIYGDFTAGDTLCVSDNAVGTLEVITSNHGRDHSRTAFALETITGGGNTTNSGVEIYLFPSTIY